MNIREATASDNEGLLNLTAATSMEARISIRIDRQPDFFSLIRQRGKYKVFVAEEGNRIIGSFSAVMERMIINSIPEPCCYICDLKVHPEYRGGSVALRLLKTMRDFLIDSGADHVVDFPDEIAELVNKINLVK